MSQQASNPISSGDIIPISSRMKTSRAHRSHAALQLPFFKPRVRRSQVMWEIVETEEQMIDLMSLIICMAMIVTIWLQR